MVDVRPALKGSASVRPPALLATGGGDRPEEAGADDFPVSYVVVRDPSEFGYTCRWLRVPDEAWL